jgi:putative SOS response-associated peptidase YedK
MCGRFRRYVSWFEIVGSRLTAPAEIGRSGAPTYNIAPSDPVSSITAGDKGAHKRREGAGGCSVGEGNAEGGDVRDQDTVPQL